MEYAIIMGGFEVHQRYSWGAGSEQDFFRDPTLFSKEDIREQYCIKQRTRSPGQIPSKKPTGIASATKDKWSFE